MFNVLAFFEALGVNATNDSINALPGTNEYVQNNHHILQQDMLLLAAYAGAASFVRARIVAPSLRIVAPPQIRPINRALLPAGDVNIADYRRNPMLLRAREEIAIEGTNNLGAATENTYAVLFVGDGNLSQPRGQLYVIRATGSTTLVASTWTSVNPTYDDALPAGRYQVVGLDAFSATGIACRMVFPGASLARPGCIMQNLVSEKPPKNDMFQEMGVYGTFDTTAMPTFEVLANAADTVETFFLTCIRL